MCVQGSNFSTITAQLAADVSGPASVFGRLPAEVKSNHNKSQHRLSAGLVNNINNNNDDNNNSILDKHFCVILGSDEIKFI